MPNLQKLNEVLTHENDCLKFALREILSTQEEEGLCDSDEALSKIYLIAEKATGAKPKPIYSMQEW